MLASGRRRSGRLALFWVVAGEMKEKYRSHCTFSFLEAVFLFNAEVFLLLAVVSGV